MRIIKTSIILASVFSMSSTALAGAPQDVVKYNCENGVKVYRNGPSAEQKTARLTRRAAYLQADLVRRQRRVQAARQEKVVAARNAAFERGFTQGQKQAQDAQAKAQEGYRSNRNRYGYGRRYSTSFYGLYGAPYYYRPAFHGPVRTSNGPRRRH